MFLRELKSVLVTAMSDVFLDAAYPEADFANGNVYISIEYPIEQQNYPGIWVDFDSSQDLKIASIDHREYVEQNDGTFAETTRWRFEGVSTYTIGSFTSLERDRLVDEVVKVFAALPGDTVRYGFRTYLEQTPLIALQVNYDSVSLQGFAAEPGTPWGTDQMIYEVTLGVSVVGEFVIGPNTNLVPIDQIIIEATPTL